MAQKNGDDVNLNLGNYELLDSMERLCHEGRSSFTAGYQNALHELEKKCSKVLGHRHISLHVVGNVGIAT
jgi:hypothetical protein